MAVVYLPLNQVIKHYIHILVHTLNLYAQEAFLAHIKRHPRIVDYMYFGAYEFDTNDSLASCSDSSGGGSYLILTKFSTVNDSISKVDQLS